MTQLSNSNINAVADLKPGYTLGAADVALLQEMARRLLAVEGQEPVAWEVKGILCHTLDEANRYVGQPEPLYAAPQPVAVPDDLYKIANHIASAKGGLPDEWQDWTEEIETDIRRAAMLQPSSGALQWIPCSERMPINDNAVLILTGYMQTAYWCAEDEEWLWGDESWFPEQVTHWMPLPAAPQEPAK